MKFRVERDVLADAVAWTAKSLPTRPPVPVLAGVRLDAAEQALTVSGFDYEVSSEVEVPIDGSETGTVLVSGRLLAEITRALPAQPVEVNATGARVEIACGSARFTLPTMPVEDYPSLPAMPEVVGTVASDAFATAVAQVAVAAGRDDTLPMLTGIRLEIEGERIVMAATDRYRLAAREITWRPLSPDLTENALVPAKTLADTAKSLTGGAEVELALSSGGAGEGMIGFAGAGKRTTTRLLDPDFPKYQSLWPKETSAVAHVETAPLVEAVKRVSLVAERNTPVRIRFAGSELVLEAGGNEEAQAVESLDAAFEGDELTIAFNPGYLLDGLGAVGSDVTRMSFTTATKPAVLTGKDGGTEYRYLLMPIRLSA
ncbi:MAG: DNA polymerase III subunit beta [Mycobacteriales bacterium]|jgi:DNA polymerase III subunit beta